MQRCPNAYWIKDLPSPDQQAEQIRENRDGTMPRFPYQRCSQSIFEAWLKKIIQEEPLIDSYFGMKFETTTESTEKGSIDCNQRGYGSETQYREPIRRWL